METAAIRENGCSTGEEILYVAMELSRGKWKLGLTVGGGQKAREVTIEAGHLDRLEKAIEDAKRRFGLGASARVVSCYEAGRDGFWLDRYLRSRGVANVVVDSSSIEVNRRARRAKSDGLDVRSLLVLLIRFTRGDDKVWSVVRVPTVEEEDGRQLHRTIEAMKADRVRHTNRIKALCVTQGVKAPRLTGELAVFRAKLEQVRLWDGSALPQGLGKRLEYEYERLEMVERQLQELTKKRREMIRTVAADGEACERQNRQVRKLIQLRGIGESSSWLYVTEFFGWRDFKNGRQVGSLAGLTPTPYQSGDSRREQGVSKAGNRLVRHMAVEIAWGWLKFQPGSELSLWYWRRFGHGGARQRRIGIVALARKLLVALWRYLDFDVLPAGAMLKA